MAEDEHFLERWSRRKTQAQRKDPDRPDGAPRPCDEPAAAAPEPADPVGPVPPTFATPKPEFDPASLPPLDSITALSDVRAFLAPGVPQELARPALRRAWSADPSIRDLIGLQ